MQSDPRAGLAPSLETPSALPASSSSTGHIPVSGPPSAQTQSKAGPSNTFDPSNPSTPSDPNPSNPSSPPSPSILIAALSAHLYIIPHTSTSILYISKLDSSGYSPLPLATTRTLIVAFITYHLLPLSRPTRRVFVQLFARSQGQYLFANSSRGAGKRVASGLGLCQWWKGVYEEVCAVEEVRGGGEVELSFLLPSYEAEEAMGMMGSSRRALVDGSRWTYAPPFASSLLDLHPGVKGEGSLAGLIPSLPDDPKTRFLDELVAEISPSDKSPTRTKSRHDDKDRPRTRKERDAAEDEAERRISHAALGRVSPEEFWERIGFRQECASGDVTGFFTLKSTSTSMPEPKSTTGSDPHPDPPPSPYDLPHAIVERIHTALLNLDFGTREAALEGSAIWSKSVRAIVSDEIGEDGWEGCTGVVEGKAGVEVGIRPEKRKDEVVTVLQPRKKKK